MTFGIAFLVLGGTCLFVWLKGRAPERYGLTVYVACFLVMVGVEAVTGQNAPAVPTLLLDTLIATAFLLLAIRYNNLWLGVTMILQGVVLGLHAMHLTDAEKPPPGHIDYYVLSIDLISMAIFITFIAGTWAGIRVRKRAGAPRSSRSRRQSSAARLASAAN